jgi:hypothetical protein
MIACAVSSMCLVAAILIIYNFLIKRKTFLSDTDRPLYMHKYSVDCRRPRLVDISTCAPCNGECYQGRRACTCINDEAGNHGN